MDNKDGGANPGYRVSVTLPWLHEHETTFWARIAIPMAGRDRGTYALPEIGDQVLVVFEHGHVDRPIVIGGLWSRSQEPVELNRSGKNNTKLIKSRCGHRIIFDDTAHAEKVILVDRTRRNKIVLDSEAKTIRIESDGDLDVIAKNNVIAHANALKIGTSGEVIGKAASLLVHAAGTFGLKAGSAVEISGGSVAINTSSLAACCVHGSGTGELGGASEEIPREQIPEHSTTVSHHSSAAPVRATSNVGRGAPAAAVARFDDEHQIEVRLVNKRGDPQANVRFDIALPDGTAKSGTSGVDGYIRLSGIRHGGEAILTLPDIDAAEDGDDDSLPR